MEQKDGFLVTGSPPKPIKVASESTNPLNVFNTAFNNVMYKGTTTWFLFETTGQWEADDDTVWYEEDPPYAMTKVYPYRWNTFVY